MSKRISRRTTTKNKLPLIASPTGRDGSIRVHQEVDLHASVLDPAVTVTHQFSGGRRGWRQIVHGSVDVNGRSLKDGDGAGISDVSDVQISATAETDILLFDMG